LNRADLSRGEELLEVVDENGNVLRIASRSELHADPSLIHRVVHVLLFDSGGKLLLQKRSLTKDIAPGKWDTSVGGHVNPGEKIGAAAEREMREELGVTDCPLRFRHSYLFSNSKESELVYTFSCEYDGNFHINKDEIEEIAFWKMEDIRANLGMKVFSSHFEKEIRFFLESD
jgi:isopentenyldiphosphate isomerase